MGEEKAREGRPHMVDVAHTERPNEGLPHREMLTSQRTWIASSRGEENNSDA